MHSLWNTVASSNSTLATPGFGIGNYIPTEAPQNAFDQNTNTKHLSLGNCNSYDEAMECGTNTGFCITFLQGPTLLLAIQFTTANDWAERDPLRITIEGSNANSSALIRGTSWSLISAMPTGLDVNPGPKADGMPQCTPNNTIWYTSYRILITSKRGYANSVQYSEVKLLGLKIPNKVENSSVSAI